MKRLSEKPKMYIVRKYIKATNIKQALRLEPNTTVHDCWIKEDWAEKHLPEAIGFDDGMTEEEEETSYTC